MNKKIKGILTPKQKKVADYVRKFYIDNGFGPSYKDIALELSLKSEGSVGQYLEALEKKGYLSRGGASRQIHMTQSEDLQEIFLLGIIPAGKPIEPLENPEPISVPKSMLPSNTMCYALKVQGESMIDDGIANGDLILVKHQSTARNGDIVVAITEDGATLKRFYLENNKVRLEPRNPNLSNIYPTQIEIRGRFLGLIRHEG